MTEKMWNKEQIEAAIDKATFNGYSQMTHDTKEKVISELTTPTPVFKVGEVYRYYDNNGNPNYFKHGFADTLKGNEHHLTPTDVPLWEKDKKALELAVEILEKTKKWYRSIGVGEFDSFVDNTLSDIRKIIE